MSTEARPALRAGDHHDDAVAMTIGNSVYVQWGTASLASMANPNAIIERLSRVRESSERARASLSLVR